MGYSQDMNQPVMALQKALEDYIGYFEKLTPRSVRLLEKLAEPGMRFTDPFHDVHGVDAVEAVLEQRLRADGQTQFRVSDHAWGRDGYTVYLRWTRTSFVSGQEQRINGVSEVMFSPGGRVAAHIDHWDSGRQKDARRPFTGWLLSRIQKKLKT